MGANRATDTRPPFFLIEESVVDDYNLHPLAGWLYVVIVRHINRKQNDAFPSVARLAKLANMSKASVMRYTKVLEAAGLISVSRERDDVGENQVNHYRLLTAIGVVSDSNYPTITQQLPVVAESDSNQKKSNQKKLTTKRAEPKEYDTVPKDDRLQIIRAWAEALSAPPIGAYKNETNHKVAAEIYREGYRAPQVALFVNAKKQDAYWYGKTLTLTKVSELMPEWLLSQSTRYTPPEVVQQPNRVPEEWGVNQFVREVSHE